MSVDESHKLECVGDRFLSYMHNPRNVGEMAVPDGRAVLTGQCGDTIGVHVAIRDNVLEKVMVQPQGCVYTTVCAGAMSVLARGLTLDQAVGLEPQDVVEELGGLPEDHLHCARLALNTLGEAIIDYYARQGKSLQEK